MTYLDTTAPPNSEYLFSVICDEYPIKIKISEEARPKYYSVRKGRGRSAKLPKRFVGKTTVDKEGFFIYEGERIIANKISVGKPKYISVNNQYIYAQKGGHFTRKIIVDGLRKYFGPIIESIPRFNELPIIVDCELHSIYDHHLPDMDNLGSIYWKVFSDMLVSKEKILDDDALHISKPGCSPRFYPIDDINKRKLIFHFYKDLNRANLNLHYANATI